MKKNTLLILTSLLAFFLWLPGMAQVVVGQQDGTTSRMPIYSCYEYSYTQQLIYQPEINAEGDITSVSFYYENGDYNSSTDWTVYLGHTDKTEFESTTDWVPFSELTEVYSGTVNFPAEGNQMIITFETPFSYNDTDNLVLAVDENQPGFNCSVYFGKTKDYSKSRGIYYRDDNNNPDPASPPEAFETVNYINNIVLGGIEQSCLPPTDLSADNLTQTTADISWTVGDNETEWEVKYGEVGFDPLTEGMSETVVDAPNTTLSDLNTGTTYDFYVKADCGDGDLSSFSFSGTFTTVCDAIGSFIENFDTTPVDEIPNCWSILSVNSTDEFAGLTVQSNGSAVSAPNDFEIYNSGDELAELFLITPELTNLNDADHQLRFFYKGSFTLADASLEIGTMSDPADPSTYTAIESISATSDFEEYTVFFDQEYTDDYIVFKVVFSGNYGRVYLDDVIWEPIPSCPKPTDLMVEGTTADTADISWTVEGEETEWEVIYGEAGFDIDSEGATLSVIDDPNIQIADLMTGTEYDVYVKAICGTDGESEMVGPISFMTQCGATDLPFTQNFEDVEIPNLPDCASQETNAGANWKTNSEAAGFDGQVLNHSWHSSETADSWYFTQGINLEAGVNYQISYKYTNGTDIWTEKLKVAFGTSANSEEMTEELADHPDISSNDVLLSEVIFTVENDGVYYFGFQAYSEANQNQLFVDDIHIDVEQTCLQPSDVIIEYITDTSAQVSWETNSGEAEWEVSYGEPGFDPAEAETLIAVENNPIAFIEDLEPGTDYEVYVRAICSVEEHSYFTGPIGFTTFDPVSENTYLCDAIILTANDGCQNGPYTNFGSFEEIDEPSGSCLTDFHGTNTVWFSFVAPENGVATISTDFPETEFNTELVVFEAPTDCEDLTTLGEEVGCATATNSSNLELVDLNPGEIYYLKVAGFNNTEGEFCIEVQTDGDTPDPCPAPSDITVEVEEMSVEVTWTPGGEEGQWTVLYGEAGFNPADEGEIIMVNDTPETTLTDLEPNTDYDVYVMAMCEEDNTSDLVGPKSFNSGDMAVEDYLFEDFSYYPNPVNDQLTLKAGTQIESVTVYNLLGQIVLTENPNQLEAQLNTDSLQAGVYLMKVSLNGSTKTFRVIKK